MGSCTTPYKMLLFCVQTIVSGSCYIKLAHLKKERKKKDTYRGPVGHESTGSKLPSRLIAFWEILREYFKIILYWMSTLSLHKESTNTVTANPVLDQCTNEVM